MAASARKQLTVDAALTLMHEEKIFWMKTWLCRLDLKVVPIKLASELFEIAKSLRMFDERTLRHQAKVNSIDASQLTIYTILMMTIFRFFATRNRSTSSSSDFANTERGNGRIRADTSRN